VLLSRASPAGCLMLALGAVQATTITVEMIELVSV
jgi:hypothetical protein